MTRYAIPCSLALLVAALPRVSESQAVRLQSVSAGDGLNCALAADGRAWCWGIRADWSRGRHVTATPVPGAVRFVSLTVIGSTACGLGTDSLAYCIGENAVAGGRRFRSVSGGGQAACGIAMDGQLWCWGSNENGVFGNGAAVPRYDSRTGYGGNVPVAAAGNARFVSVSVDRFHACGLDEEGTAWCWGQNDAGQLGDGTTQAHFEPRPVEGDHRYRQLATGMRTTCGITQDGMALCWGANAGAVPTPVQGGLRWRQIATARDMACGVAEDGAAWCWGTGVDGMLGTGEMGEPDRFSIHYLRASAPVAVAGGVRFQSVSIGSYSVCGLSVDGDAWCWGRNDDWQLGIPNESRPGGVNNSATPLRVPIRAAPVRPR